jgi:hypothetical protein
VEWATTQSCGSGEMDGLHSKKMEKKLTQLPDVPIHTDSAEYDNSFCSPGHTLLKRDII